MEANYSAGSSALSVNSTKQLVTEKNKSMKTRVLYALLFILAVAVIGLVIALIVVVSNDDDDDKPTAEMVTQGPVHMVPDCPLNSGSSTPELDKAKCILESYPLIDGHNDLPFQFRYHAKNNVYSVDMKKNLEEVWPRNNLTGLPQTDIPRLRAGRVGAQFWACFVFCSGQYKDAVRMSLDQMDVIKKFVYKYPDTFEFVTTAQGILNAFSRGKIGSLIGLEGGHSIDSSLGNLRMFYDLGARYMTVTHSCNTPWADNWKADLASYNATVSGPKHNGLTDFGKIVIKEMNRLGMMVDLSHVAKQTMIDSISVSEAPVIYSHSSAFTICNHYRNVQDDVLQMTKTNGGLVMVVVYDAYINCVPNNITTPTVQQVANHIDHIKNLIGVDHVGIGADYDGVPTFPVGLEDVSTFPVLFEEMVKRGWSTEDLQKLAGRNLIRVFTETEKVRDRLSYKPPYEDLLPEADRWPQNECRTDF